MKCPGLSALPAFGGMKASKRMLFLHGQCQVSLLNPNQIQPIFIETLSRAGCCSDTRDTVHKVDKVPARMAYMLLGGETESASK